MATRHLTRALLATKLTTTAFAPKSSSSLFRLRPLVAAAPVSFLRRLAPVLSARGFSTRQTTSSLNDPNPNWSNRPPKETILLDGCDFEHWLVVLEKPEGDPTRDEIIASYIKTLATIVGSEEEARMKIYSVSTRHYFAFGALVNEELSYKLKELPQVRWVLPDSYLDVRNKDYGGEPFIDGQAVPYDPKYHEEWVRNNARANERNRRNDRPRNFDRSRNFDRRNAGGPGGNMGGNPSNTGGGMPPHNMGGQPSNDGPPQQNYGGGARNYPPPPPPPPQPTRGTPYQPGQGTNFNQNMGSGPGPNQNFSPNMGPPNQNISPNPGYGGGPNQGSYVPNPRPGYAPNMGPGPVQNQNGYAPNSGGGPNMGPGPVQNQNGYSPNSGGGPNMGPGPVQNQNGYSPNSGGGNPYQNQNQNVPGRDFPHSASY